MLPFESLFEILPVKMFLAKSHTNVKNNSPDTGSSPILRIKKMKI